MIKNRLSPIVYHQLIQDRKQTNYKKSQRNRKNSNEKDSATFDALWYGQNKTYFFKEKLRHILQNSKPKLTIFALNEDGLYSDSKSKKLIEELKEKDLLFLKIKDVTGE